LLKTVADRMPSLYRFCWLSYANITSLQFREITVWSVEGAQQGDPLGVLLFCSATWDVTVVHTLVASYIQWSAVEAGSAASAASERNSAKYNNFAASHMFYPVAVETLGVLADQAHVFISEIGRRAFLSTADPRETAFLYQRISAAIQRFNAVCLSNTFTISESPL